MCCDAPLNDRKQKLKLDMFNLMFSGPYLVESYRTLTKKYNKLLTVRVHTREQWNFDFIHVRCGIRKGKIVR